MRTFTAFRPTILDAVQIVLRATGPQSILSIWLRIFEKLRIVTVQ